MKIEKKFRLGCIQSPHSINDVLYRVVTPVELPARHELSPMPAITNQGNLGSCSGHGTARAFQRRLMKEKLDIWHPSRLMIYYGARELDGTVPVDAGATIKNAIKTVAVTGVAKERLWPYKIPAFNVKPPKAAYDDASKNYHKALIYKRLSNSLQEAKTALVTGNALVIGFAVYNSFYTIGKDGRMPIPVPGEYFEGGHCVTIEGYDDARQRFICGNSWGSQWGDKGRFYMHYNFYTNPKFVFDSWVIEDV